MSAVPNIIQAVTCGQRGKATTEIVGTSTGTIFYATIVHRILTCFRQLLLPSSTVYCTFGTTHCTFIRNHTRTHTINLDFTSPAEKAYYC